MLYMATFITIQIKRFSCSSFYNHVFSFSLAAKLQIIIHIAK